MWAIQNQVCCSLSRRGVTSGAESSSNGAGPGLRQAEPATGPQGGSGGGGSSNGAGPEEKPPRVPHRWRVVGMMALAFVLCNMDKVRAPRLPAVNWHASVLCSVDSELAGRMCEPAQGRHARFHVLASLALHRSCRARHHCCEVHHCLSN